MLPLPVPAGGLIAIQLAGVLADHTHAALVVTEIVPEPPPADTDVDAGESAVVLQLSTVNSTPLLVSAPTVTPTSPVVAPDGTVTLMLVLLHALAAAASVPLNLTELDP